MRLRGQLALGLVLTLIIGLSNINIISFTTAQSRNTKSNAQLNRYWLTWDYNNTISFSKPTPYHNTQVPIILNGSNIDYTLIQPNGEDLRFLSPEGIPCDYWIATWNPNDNSIIWVEVPRKGTDRIFMYYGNPTAEPLSNGSATFLMFDDFNDDSLDLTLWEEFAGGTYTEIDGILTLTGGGTDSEEAIYERTNRHYGEIVVEFSMLVSHQITTNGQLGLTNWTQRPINWYYAVNRGWIYARLGEICYFDHNCNHAPYVSVYREPALEGFHTFVLTYTNTSFQITRDNQLMHYQSSNAAADGWYFFIRHWDTSRPAQEVDWVRIRRYHGGITTQVGEVAANGIPDDRPWYSTSFIVGWLTFISISWIFIISAIIRNTHRTPSKP